MIESYDGLCGIIATFASSGNRIRCHYELAHSGPCSFAKHRNQFQITAGSFRGDWHKCRNSDGETHGFTQSVLDQTHKNPVVVVNADGDIETK